MDNVWNKTDFWHERRSPWKIPGLALRNIKYSFQRITKGYCDKDLWNIDYWFMNLMPDMLQQFKDTKHGSPSCLEKEYADEHGNFSKNSTTMVQTYEENYKTLMGDGTFMDKNFIEELNKYPYESLMFKSLRGEFWIEESFTKTEYCIEGEIRCGIQGIDFWCGDVEIYIGIDRLKNEHRAGFWYLEVSSMIGNRGIGTTLMLSVIDTIRVFKEFYSVSEAVTVCGWLSTVDKRNGNWNISIPLYAKVGKLANVENYFTIENDENHYTADEFLGISDSDGSIIYAI